jgi:CheY-like chemotaxis protein/HD-like signal output (HDOD) protein
MTARIIVAEDTAPLREQLSASLGRAGYEVRTAADGRELLNLVEKHGAPELILLDIAMPRMDGIACLRHLRRAWDKQTLPVIVLSAQSNQSQVLEIVKLGISDYLLKSSFSEPSLLHKVERALGVGGPRSDAATDPSIASRPLSGETTPTPPPDTSKEPGGSPSQSETKNGNHEPARPTVVAFGTRGERPSFTPLIDRKGMERRLRDSEMGRGFGPAVTHLLKTIDNPEARLAQIAESASLDQALAARVLWWANSVAGCRGAPVASVHKAVVRIGTNKIREAALTLAVLERFREGGGDVIHSGRFWEHGVTVGATAAELARCSPRTQDLDPNVAFTAGLLHDVGRLVMLEELGDLYAEVLNTAREHELPLVEVEREMLHTTHAHAAKIPLLRWRFTNDLIRPVTFHHLPVDSILQLTGPESTLTAVLALANSLGHAWLLGDSGDDVVEDTSRLVTALGLSDDVLVRLEAQTLEAWRDLRGVVAMCSWRDWPDQLSVLRDGLNTRARPCLLESPGWSVYRQLFNRLFGEAGARHPNIWVARIDRWDEIESHAKHIVGWESVRSRERLPLLLIAPAEVEGRLPEDLGERAVSVTPSPLSVRGLIRAVNDHVAWCGTEDALAQEVVEEAIESGP